MTGAPSGAAASRPPVALRRAVVLVTFLCALWLSCGRATAIAPAPPLDVTAAGLMDADTGQILFGRSSDTERPIASTTKLMTALITLEREPLNAVFTEPAYYPAAVDSQIGLVPGERMTVHDLLLALLLPSADDAAEDLAYNVGHGSVSRFVAMMNEQARQLGLSHTHYSTPIGLDTPGNYSSAADLLKLTRFDLDAEPFFHRAVALTSARLRSGDHPRLIINRNDLVGRVPWINGVKTGHTSQAGYVLVGSGTQNGMTLISAVLGTPSEAERDATTLSLLKYGFANFALVTPVRAGAVIARPAVKGRAHLRASVVAQTGFQRAVGRGVRVTTHALLARRLTGPLARGARVGTLVVRAGGTVLGRVPLILARAIPAPAPKVAIASLAVPITLVSALVLVLGAGLATGFGRGRARGTAAKAGRRG